ncbi:hypothetical protein U0C82_03655 [Fulvimarina sp. 2208YS6-2-32]|uniref:Glycoside hydrolase family 19 catalytic domain-containing protein n=1 Tax=Fulvimarina uroteuthidis TaxID=3098149 RepID=A0ABU5HYP9_9HYPH|nr:hypothetical protein [Fulvimarina sp. 2208YS6-2-32]MDY8108244.1 hypothetical protein [Fulvimarina sp. 2208YS6-2-32]
MDRAAFFKSVRARPFGGALSQSAVDGLSALIAAFDQYGDGDVRKLAYILATAFHECDRFRSMEEYASGAAYEGRKDLGNTEPGDGKRFKGRGFVMITGRANYTDWSDRLDMDLLANPGLVKDRAIAARICVEGMMLGTFTGKDLPDYINDAKADYVNARRTVNGTDRASMIAGYAAQMLTALKAAKYGAEPKDEPAMVEAPKPITPAPVGGPRAKANGGAAGVAVATGLLTLVAKLGWIPPEVASDPETVILLSGFLLAVGGYVGAFFAPKNAA